MLLEKKITFTIIESRIRTLTPRNCCLFTEHLRIVLREATFYSKVGSLRATSENRCRHDESVKHLKVLVGAPPLLA